MTPITSLYTVCNPEAFVVPPASPDIYEILSADKNSFLAHKKPGGFKREKAAAARKRPPLQEILTHSVFFGGS